MASNWQVFLARELTARAMPSRSRTSETGEREVVSATPSAGEHMIGALIVRHLAARTPDLDRAMQSVPQGTQAEWVGADFPQEYVKALSRMWSSVDVPETGPAADPNRTARALRVLARVAYLTLPPKEVKAAREIAARSKDLPWFGAKTAKTGGGEEAIWGGGWDVPVDVFAEPQGASKSSSGLGSMRRGAALSEEIAEAAGALSGVLGGFGAGFGSLRTELRDAAPEDQRSEVLRLYDGLNSNASERRRWIKVWQEWAKGKGRYDGTVDGLWGPKSEAAWVSFVPESYGRPSTRADLQKVLAFGGIEAVAVLAAAIGRDKWVAANPTRLPPPPQQQQAEAPTATPEGTPGLAEEEVVIHPEEEETGEPPPEPPREVTVGRPIWRPGTPLRQRVSIVPVEEPRTSGASSGEPNGGKRSWTPWLVGAGVAALMIGAVAFSGRGKKPPYEEP